MLAMASLFSFIISHFSYILVCISVRFKFSVTLQYTYVLYKLFLLHVEKK
jgi:hypothetical protein